MLQLILLLCIDQDFFYMIRQHDSMIMIRPRGYQAHRRTRKIMKVLHHDSERRLGMAGDFLPIFVRELDKGNNQCSFYEYRICFKNR